VRLTDHVYTPMCARTGTATARGVMRGVVLAWVLPATVTGTAALRHTDQLPTHTGHHMPPLIAF
jgi:hypothetical protein